MVMHPHTKYHRPTCISKDKNVMTRTRKYYLKNNYQGPTKHNIFFFRDMIQGKYKWKCFLLIIVPLSFASISFTRYVSIHESDQTFSLTVLTKVYCSNWFFLTFPSVYSHDSESGHYLGKVWDNNINGPLGEHIFLITFYNNHFPDGSVVC
jgi:hypothetical protein